MQLPQGLVVTFGHACRNCGLRAGQLRAHVVALGPGTQLAQLPTSAHFTHVGDANCKARRNLGNRAGWGQHPIAQVLPVGLASMPSHLCASYLADSERSAQLR